MWGPPKIRPTKFKSPQGPTSPLLSLKEEKAQYASIMKFSKSLFFTVGLSAAVLIPYFLIPSVYVYRHDKNMRTEFRVPEIELSINEDVEESPPKRGRQPKKEQIEDIRFHHIK